MDQCFRRVPSKLLPAMSTAIDNLTIHPYIGRPIGQDGLRKLTIPQTPFSVFYRVIEDRIEIVRIWDQRADPEKLEFHEEAQF